MNRQTWYSTRAERNRPPSSGHLDVKHQGIGHRRTISFLPLGRYGTPARRGIGRSAPPPQKRQTPTAIATPSPRADPGAQLLEVLDQAHRGELLGLARRRPMRRTGRPGGWPHHRRAVVAHASRAASVGFRLVGGPRLVGDRRRGARRWWSRRADCGEHGVDVGSAELGRRLTGRSRRERIRRRHARRRGRRRGRCR